MTVENANITLNISSEAPKRQKKDVKSSLKSAEKITKTGKHNIKLGRVKQKNLGAIVAKNRLKIVGKKVVNDVKKKSSSDHQDEDKQLVTFVEPSQMKGKTILAKQKQDKSGNKSLSSIFAAKIVDESSSGSLILNLSAGKSNEKKTENKSKRSTVNGKDEQSNEDKSRKILAESENEDLISSNHHSNTGNRTKESPVGSKDGKNGKKQRKNEEWSRKKSSETKTEDSKRPNYQSTKSSLFGNNPEIPNLGQRLVKPISEKVFTKIKFSELDIHPFMVSNLEQNMNFVTSTTVQQKSIPEILAGKDVLIRSQTGSGKTLAYGIPIVESLHKIRPKLSRNSGLRALVIVPTRELALQTYEAFLKLVKPFTWIVPGYLCGGEKRKAEKARLRRGCNILIATPGRLLDHIQHTEALKLDEVSCLVLDEADRMLDMGYEKDIAGVIAALDKPPSSYDPMKIFRQNQKQNVKIVFDDEETKEAVDDNKIKTDQSEKYEDKETKRQTILLSATLTSAVEHLAGLTMTNPLFIDAAKENSSENPSLINEDLIVPEKVVQSYVIVPPKLKLVTLSAYIISKCQTSSKHKTLVFMPTQDMVDYYSDIISLVLTQEDEDEYSQALVNVEFFKLHGNMDQKERTNIFKTFREASTGILFTTDVAARGLDLPKVDTVIQYTGPLSARDYVHRIGRTARGGTSGVAIIILTPPEVEFVRMLEAKRIRIKQEDMDNILQHLTTVNSKHLSPEYTATDLQNKFENILLENKKYHGAACKAYTSWIRFYSSYPREMRQYFDRNELHLGHYAKSFGLRDPPKRIGMIGKSLEKSNIKKHENRLNKPRNEDTMDSGKNKKSNDSGNKTMGMLKRCIMLNTSEYSDGLESVKKVKK